MNFTFIKTLLRPINNPISRSLNKVYPSLNQSSFDFLLVHHSLNNCTFTQAIVKEILIYLEIEFVLDSGTWATSCTHILLLLQLLSMQPEKEEDGEPILFYGKTNPEYEFLSNFYDSPFKISEHVYPTNEHFFQSKKFEGTPQEEQVIAAKDPKTAKALGRKFKMDRPQNWPQIKEKVMLMGLRAKFEQNKQLLEKLLATGNRQLREHTPRDKYWGDGGKKNTGQNRLGVLLMQVRQEFRAKK